MHQQDHIVIKRSYFKILVIKSYYLKIVRNGTTRYMEIYMVNKGKMVVDKNEFEIKGKLIAFYTKEIRLALMLGLQRIEPDRRTFIQFLNLLMCRGSSLTCAPA